MAYQAAHYRSGPTLYLTAFATVASVLLAVTFLATVLLGGFHSPTIRALGSFSVVALLVAAPIAIAASLLVRCPACDRLLIPLVYDGKTLFAPGGPTAWAIGATAVSVVFRRRASCPHCHAETHV